MTDFDAVVIGTGMGGGAAGFQLARAGLTVLFIERGLPARSFEPALGGTYAEHHALRGDASALSRAARARLRLGGATPVLGEGEGGGSAVYGAALLPLTSSDFARWPFGADALKPFYDEVDRLFRPRGTQDPLGERRELAEPDPMPTAQTELFAALEREGLHPFRTPVAYRAVPGCGHCFGFFCEKDCKQTAGTAFVQPALEKHGARAEFATRVDAIEVEDSRAVVRCTSEAGPRTVTARVVFVAAGALRTPVLLRQSRSSRFPEGLGNQADQLGRHLMRHLVDFYYLRMASTDGVGRHLIEVSCTDLARDRSAGVNVLLNAAGALMPPDLMVEKAMDAQLPRVPGLRAVVRPFARRFVTTRTRGRILVTSIVEDEADPNNRVLPESTQDELALRYALSARDASRLAELRRRLTHLFRPFDAQLFKVAEDNSFLAHVCGTCRMGSDAKTSVVDPTGRVHGTERVYVVDSSVFPSSGSANPSMTVAALALKLTREFLETTWKR